MACEFYLEGVGGCGNGLPLVPSYGGFICARHPEKCPVFLWKRAGTARDGAGRGEGAAEGGVSPLLLGEDTAVP